ncbi:Pr6Pr family membrane protein [Microbacterium jejuense]|uniref:Pr6Pr family membrane protein n=1 Tax=Microbacterium jejuense TaxID=1263637 RepID=UPI0031E9307E
MRTATGAWVWIGARAAMSLLIAAAVVRQLAASIGTALELGRDVVTTIANFLSFFTILSNAAAAIVLAWAAIWFWTKRRDRDAEPPGLATALASVSTYMIVTGIVYNLLLRSVVLPQGSEPVWWSNEVLHLIGPLFLLADVFVGPLRRRLPWRALWAIVAFPIVWVGYTMVRGPLTTNPVSGEPFWYPYPFLNPNNDGGWGSVIVYVIGIAIAIVAVGALVVWWGRRAADRGVVASVPQTADTL